MWNESDYVTEEELDAYLRSQGITDLEDEPEGDHSPNYNQSARRMLFSGYFSDEARALLEQEGACCTICGSTEDLTLDHVKSVGAYFNELGYRQTREQRNAWYTNTENLRVLCRSCNSRKGGARFNPQKVAECCRERRN